MVDREEEDSVVEEWSTRMGLFCWNVRANSLVVLPGTPRMALQKMRCQR